MQGRNATDKEIRDFAYEAVSPVGPGLGLTVSLGTKFIKEMESSIEGKEDMVEEISRKISVRFEYDTLTVACGVAPLLPYCKAVAFKGFEKGFHFDYAKEKGFFETAVVDHP